MQMQIQMQIGGLVPRVVSPNEPHDKLPGVLARARSKLSFELSQLERQLLRAGGHAAVPGDEFGLFSLRASLYFGSVLLLHAMCTFGWLRNPAARFPPLSPESPILTLSQTSVPYPIRPSAISSIDLLVNPKVFPLRYGTIYRPYQT